MRDNMTLQNCISGVSNPIENHTSMILPLLSVSYISQYPPIALTEAVMNYHNTEPEKRRQSNFSPTMTTR